MNRLLQLVLFSSLLFTCSAARAVTPAQIQARACPSGGGTGYSTVVCPLSSVTQTGNWLIFSMQYGAGTSPTIAVTDDKSDTFTVDCTGVSGDGNQKYWIGHVAATAGAHIITVTFTGATANLWQATTGEYNNITAFDVCSAGATGTGTAVTSGNLTPSQTGDLIISITGNETGATKSQWTVGSNPNVTWLLQQSDPGFAASNMVAEGVEWGQYNSAATINPAITAGTSITWGSLAAAYKTGAAGSGRPAGIYISSAEHYNIVACTSPCVIPIPVDAADNLVVLGCINGTNGGASAWISGITQTGAGSGNTWVEIGHRPDNTGSGHMSMWYATGTFGNADRLNVSVNAGGSFGSADCVAYGLVNAGILDTSLSSSNGTCNPAGFCWFSSTQGAPGSPLSTLAITPSTSSGMMMAMAGVTSPQIRGVVNGLTDVAYSPQEQATNELGENNGRANNPYSSNAAFTWSWTNSSAAGLGNYQVTAVAFEPASGGGGSSGTINICAIKSGGGLVQQLSSCQ